VAVVVVGILMNMKNCSPFAAASKLSDSPASAAQAVMCQANGTLDGKETVGGVLQHCKNWV
jgi:hypothetical protein